MRALVIDDEAPARRRMLRLLGSLGVESLEAGDGHEALAVLEQSAVDVLLLDVCMPGLDGLALVSQHGSLPPIVFVTAHAEFAVRAFELEAVDYLLKPVRPERLAAALKRVAQQPARAATRPWITSEPPRQAVDTFHNLNISPCVRPCVAVSERGQLRVFSVSDIPCFRASDKYTLFCAGGAEQATAESLNALEMRLSGHGFARVHRSALINLAHVLSLRCAEGAGELTLEDGQCIPVSRRALPGLREQLRARTGR